jgi:hypothetical protein
MQHAPQLHALIDAIPDIRGKRRLFRVKAFCDLENLTWGGGAENRPAPGLLLNGGLNNRDSDSHPDRCHDQRRPSPAIVLTGK